MIITVVIQTLHSPCHAIVQQRCKLFDLGEWLFLHFRGTSCTLLDFFFFLYFHVFSGLSVLDCLVDVQLRQNASWWTQKGTADWLSVGSNCLYPKIMWNQKKQTIVSVVLSNWNSKIILQIFKTLESYCFTVSVLGPHGLDFHSPPFTHIVIALVYYRNNHRSLIFSLCKNNTTVILCYVATNTASPPLNASLCSTPLVQLLRYLTKLSDLTSIDPLYYLPFMYSAHLYSP